MISDVRTAIGLLRLKPGILVEAALPKFVTIYETLGQPKPQVIFDVGSRDGQEALAFGELYPEADVYFFECNPATLPLCRAMETRRDNLHLIEKAVSDSDGKVVFYPIDPDRTRTSWEDGNPGASSLLKASGKYPVEDYAQSETRVDSIRLESFLSSEGANIAEIDMIWMDIQGGELRVLQGLGRRLAGVRALHVEVEFLEIYEGQPLFQQVKRFLNQQGFLLAGFTNLGDYSGDAVFINRNVIADEILRNARRFDRLARIMLLARRLRSSSFLRAAARSRAARRLLNARYRLQNLKQ